MAPIKLFTRPINNTPSDSQKLAFGDGTSPEENITFGNFATYLMGKLGFFKVANLFSEIYGNASAQATARNNLDVYSKSAIDGLANIVAYKDNVIEKNSTAPFTPSLATHPTNKGYVDGIILVSVRTVAHDDNLTHTDVTKLGGVASVAGMSYGRPSDSNFHIFDHNLGNDKYIPIINLINTSRPNCSVGVVGYTANQVSFYVNDSDGNSDIYAVYDLTLLRV